MLFCVCLQFCSFWQNALRLLSKQRRDWLVMAPNSCEESKQKTVLVIVTHGRFLFLKQAKQATHLIQQLYVCDLQEPAPFCIFIFTYKQSPIIFLGRPATRECFTFLLIKKIILKFLSYHPSLLFFFLFFLLRLQTNVGQPSSMAKEIVPLYGEFIK